MTLTAASEYLEFTEEQLSPAGKTKYVGVYARRSGARLGGIRWFGRWRQYVFVPERETVFNPTCLREIADRVDALTVEHRALGATEAALRSGEASVQ